MSCSIVQSPLGKKSSYSAIYDPSLLFRISRTPKRDEIRVKHPLPFQGVDIWNAYELSWLNRHGKPQVAFAEIFVPCESPDIFESKSLKLYLNSFNQSVFDSSDDVKTAMETDLSEIVNSQVSVKIILPSEFKKIAPPAELDGECIDDLEVEACTYEWNPHYLETEDAVADETLVSHLLRSNCLVTEQPDWGSISIYYKGKKINQKQLLKYIISFRNHYEFHEQCVERIFMDIMKACKPEKLSVYARYARRGGIDINPFRSNFTSTVSNIRHYRQ